MIQCVFERLFDWGSLFTRLRMTWWRMKRNERHRKIVRRLYSSITEATLSLLFHYISQLSLSLYHLRTMDTMNSVCRELLLSFHLISKKYEKLRCLSVIFPFFDWEDEVSAAKFFIHSLALKMYFFIAILWHEMKYDEHHFWRTFLLVGKRYTMIGDENEPSINPAPLLDRQSRHLNISDDFVSSDVGTT